MSHSFPQSVLYFYLQLNIELADSDKGLQVTQALLHSPGPCLYPMQGLTLLTLLNYRINHPVEY